MPEVPLPLPWSLGSDWFDYFLEESFSFPVNGVPICAQGALATQPWNLGFRLNVEAELEGGSTGVAFVLWLFGLLEAFGQHRMSTGLLSCERHAVTPCRAFVLCDTYLACLKSKISISWG